MGSDHWQTGTEQIIDVEAFWVDQTEITNALYNLCVTAGSCPPLSNNSSRKHESYYGNPKYDDFPVVYITYDDAESYCEWAGRHLPSYVEWEKAARGTDGRMYPWGEFSPAKDNSSTAIRKDLSNFTYLIGDTSKVGAYPKGASPYGALDMAGNVQEWVIISNPIIQISISEEVATSNQLVYDLDYYHLARGGFFNSARDEVQTTSRSFFSKTYSNYYVGFRCAQDTTPQE
jgi:formylglycine-generating enzyme required for sulfatase activity